MRLLIYPDQLHFLTEIIYLCCIYGSINNADQKGIV